MSRHPPFIRAIYDVPEQTHSYLRSNELLGPIRRLGKEAGLERLGINIQRLPPGARSSWPHAEEREEEFVYVIEGHVDAWIDGYIHSMQAGDIAAFPAGTGITHCFINNRAEEAVLLVGGEAPKANNRLFYPLNPARRTDLAPSEWWGDMPKREFGPDDGLPDALREQRSIVPRELSD